jgi:DNA-binding NarL/FixJ family response regulator
MERNAEDVLALGCLEAVLERLELPTFIARTDGAVRYQNSLGRVLRERDPLGLESELRAAIAGERTPHPFVSTPLTIAGWYLDSAAAGATDICVERARRQYRLTRRQRDVLELVVVGATNRTIAELLGITERTVEVHLSAIYERAGVENRATLVSRVLRTA